MGITTAMRGLAVIPAREQSGSVTTIGVYSSLS